MRRRFVMAVAETVKACRCAPEVDDNKEKRSQDVEAEMRAKPRQPDRQGHARGIRLAADQPVDRAQRCGHANRQGGAIDHCSGHLRAAQRYREDRYPEQSRDTPHLQNDGRNHARALVPPGVLFPDRASTAALVEPDLILSRTPRPCELLTAPSPIISIPAASNAAISLTSESTLPRTIVSLASMR